MIMISQTLIEILQSTWFSTNVTVSYWRLEVIDVGNNARVRRDLLGHKYLLPTQVKF